MKTFRVVAGRPVREPDYVGWPLTIALSLFAMCLVGAVTLVVLSLDKWVP